MNWLQVGCSDECAVAVVLYYKGKQIGTKLVKLLLLLLLLITTPNSPGVSVMGEEEVQAWR